MDPKKVGPLEEFEAKMKERFDNLGPDDASYFIKLALATTPEQLRDEMVACQPLFLKCHRTKDEERRLMNVYILRHTWQRVVYTGGILPPPVEVRAASADDLPDGLKEKLIRKAEEMMDRAENCGDPDCPVHGKKNRKKDTNNKGNNTVPDTEVERLEDFFAREVIELVKNECWNTMADPNDPKEVVAIVKDMLNGRNLKKNIFARVKHHLGVE